MNDKTTTTTPETAGDPYPTGPYPTADRLKVDGHLAGWTERDGDLWQWTGRAYERRTPKRLRNYIGRLLADQSVTCGTAWEPNQNKLNNVIDALQLDDVPDPDGQVLALSNGLFDPVSGRLMTPTPTRFVTNFLPYPFDADALCPAWEAFLQSVWPDDPESIALLQQWMGYLVSGETAMQKALLMIGPKRSGKGTILRVAEELLGPDSTGALRMSNLGSWFGMQTVVGKRLAVIGDLRIDGRLQAPAVEALLSITGEDIVNVQRKGVGQDPVDVRLRARIMAATNVAPIFADPGGALPTRFAYLVFRESFDGKEDFELGKRLSAELPGILNWAVDGWLKLRASGRFTVPSSAAEVMLSAVEDASPVGRFLEECCERDGEVVLQALYSAWKPWQRDRGHRPLSDAEFGAEVRSMWPHVRKRRGSGPGGSRPNVYVGVSLK